MRGRARKCSNSNRFLHGSWSSVLRRAVADFQGAEHVGIPPAGTGRGRGRRAPAAASRRPDGRGAACGFGRHRVQERQRRGLGDLRVAPAQRAGAVVSDQKHVGVGGRGGRPQRRRAPPEQVLVEVFAEGAADQVQGDRVDARVGEAQAEPDDAQNVPECVVFFCGPRVVVEPKHE